MAETTAADIAADPHVTPDATYDQGEVLYPGSIDALEGARAAVDENIDLASKTDARPTRYIDAPQRRHITPIDFPALTADQIALLPVNGRVLMGWNVTESSEAGAVAELIIRHGQNDQRNSTQIDRIVLAANITLREWYGPDGIDIPDGVFLDFIAGTMDVTLFYGHE